MNQKYSKEYKDSAKPEICPPKGFSSGEIDNVQETVEYPFQNTGLINGIILPICMNKWSINVGLTNVSQNRSV